VPKINDSIPGLTGSDIIQSCHFSICIVGLRTLPHPIRIHSRRPRSIAGIPGCQIASGDGQPGDFATAMGGPPQPVSKRGARKSLTPDALPPGFEREGITCWNFLLLFVVHCRTADLVAFRIGPAGSSRPVLAVNRNDDATAPMSTSIRPQRKIAKVSFESVGRNSNGNQEHSWRPHKILRRRLATIAVPMTRHREFQP
jgi:hypothetical protein